MSGSVSHHVVIMHRFSGGYKQFSLLKRSSRGCGGDPFEGVMRYLMVNLDLYISGVIVVLPGCGLVDNGRIV